MLAYVQKPFPICVFWSHSLFACSEAISSGRAFISHPSICACSEAIPPVCVSGSHAFCLRVLKPSPLFACIQKPLPATTLPCSCHRVALCSGAHNQPHQLHAAARPPCQQHACHPPGRSQQAHPLT